MPFWLSIDKLSTQLRQIRFGSQLFGLGSSRKNALAVGPMSDSPLGLLPHDIADFFSSEIGLFSVEAVTILIEL